MTKSPGFEPRALLHLLRPNQSREAAIRFFFFFYAQERAFADV